jgi:arylsulfatase A-like enzyme
LLPSQHGIHCYLPEPQKDEAPFGGECAIRAFPSLPKILSQSGYVCGLSGKWHLGDYLRPQEGFSYWFTMPGGHTYSFYNANVIWDGKVRTEPRYLTDAITDHALEFIRQNQARPFFLWLSYDGPYGVSDCFLEPHKNRHSAYYADKPLNCFPREKVHPWQKHRTNLLNNPVAIRGYAAAVSGIDDGVGRVLDELRKLRLDDDTLVVFTSDQGLSGGQGGIWGLGEHTEPVHTREATVRIPLIFRHPKQIPALKFSDHLIGSYDFFPTMLRYLGLAGKIPTNPPLPGRDFTPLLRGEDISWDEVVFHEFETTRMVRTPRWKYTQRYPKGPNELYDMDNDAEERRDLAGRPESQEREKELAERLQRFFDRYAVRDYDLTRGGHSRVNRLKFRRPEEEVPRRGQ